MSLTEKKYTAIDLVDKVLEFIAIAPHEAEWDFGLLDQEPNKYIRLKQIESLIQALLGNIQDEDFLERTKVLFNGVIKPSLSQFWAGEFIKQRSPEEYTGSIEFINEYIKKHCTDLKFEQEIQLKDLAYLFHELMKYKKALYHLTHFHSVWPDEAASHAQFSMHITRAISNNLDGKHAELDQILTLLIDPKNLSLSEATLVEKFGYPLEEAN